MDRALPYLDEIVLADARLKSSPTPSGDFDDAPVRAEDFEALKKLEQSGKAATLRGRARPRCGCIVVSRACCERCRRRTGRGCSTSGSALAISTAVDRREYCKQVFYGACDPMAGPVSPANVVGSILIFRSAPATPSSRARCSKSRGLRDRDGDGLLEDATLRPLRFTLLIRRDLSASARAAQFLAATLKTIGVQMDVTPLTADALAARRQKGDVRRHLRSRRDARHRPGHAARFLAQLWREACLDWRARTPADWERQIDQLMLKNAEAFDRIERLQAFIDAQKIYLQHMPAIFFGTPHIRIATSVRTLNATPSPLRPHVLWNAEALAALK